MNSSSTGALPGDYVEFLRISDGLQSPGNLNILEADGVVARNQDYEVQQYLPGYFMIGDDGGGIAILIRRLPRIVLWL